MEDQNEKDMAVFQQICEVNELDPQAIMNEVEQTSEGDSATGGNIEKLIWTAFDHRARTLLQSLEQGSGIKGDKAEYKIDSDPTAPAFVVNEDYIRNQYDAGTADEIISALGHVQLPITA